MKTAPVKPGIDGRKLLCEVTTKLKTSSRVKNKYYKIILLQFAKDQTIFLNVHYYSPIVSTMHDKSI